MKRVTRILAALALLFIGVERAKAGPISLAIVTADGSAASPAPVAQLLDTGEFSRVTVIDATSSTPSLDTLRGYDAVLAYTNVRPSDPTSLGDILADYADEGHRVTLATFGFSDPVAIGGRIMTSGYSPFVNVGVNGDVSGRLVAVNPDDPLFVGINLAAIAYFHNINFSYPGLDTGATLLATDGSGINMIAQNSAGNIIGLNFFPPLGGKKDFFHLIANSLTIPASPQAEPAISAVPEPSTAILVSLGAAGITFAGWRRRKNTDIHTAA